MDPRIEQLAYNLVHNSCRLQKGEKVMIHQNGIPSGAAGKSHHQRSIQNRRNTLFAADDKLFGT